MKSNVEEIIEEGIQKYRLKPKIVGRKYDLYIFSEDEDLNLFEGFLYSRIESKDELSYLINKYKPGGGYAARLGLLIYRNQLIIKDYRQDKLIRKTLEKVNETFIKKLKGAIAEPNKDNLNKLFDRTDIIEEFYLLYRKSREYLLKNLKGISKGEKRIEFIDNLMMQLLTLWYLQEKGFFNKDTSYFITKFKELKQSKLLKEFDSFYKFLLYLFNKISNRVNSQYYEDHIVGKVVVAGPAIFLNGEHNSEAISIPDKCFYVEGKTEYLIEANPKKISEDVPLLNLLESRDWTEGNIDEFVLGAIYEKLITYDERKKLGAYYTPEEITSYICKNTIAPYLVDRINRRFGENFETIDSVIESERKDILIYLFEQLKEIKICDPAVGSAHFLESAINVLVDIYKKLWNKAKEIGLKKGLDILVTNESGNIEKINLVSLSDEEQFKLYIKFFIILSRNIYGVDINPSALKIAKARLFLTLAKHFDVNKNYFIRFPNVHFNLRDGNSLIGYVEISKRKGEIKQLKLDLQLSDDETEYIAEKIKELPEDLAKYLQNTAEALNIDGDIQTEIRELNRILSKKKIEWDDFEKVLKTKEKLIQILIVSLNSQYAMPLNYLLNKITELFNHKLDEKFAKEHNIDLNELREIKTFHWIFEFPEVFLRENPGFDVVIGNPPYLDSEEMSREAPLLRDLLNRLYLSAKGNWDIFCTFIEKSITLSKYDSYFSMIVPNKLLSADYARYIRKIILTNDIISVRDYSRILIFPSNVYPIVFICRCSSSIENIFKSEVIEPESYNIIFSREIKQKDLLDNNSWAFIFESVDDIFDYIMRSSVSLGNIFDVFGSATVSEAYEISKILFEASKIDIRNNNLLFINSGTIDRYTSLWGIKDTTYLKRKLNNPIVLKNNLKKLSVKRYNQAISPKIIIAGLAKKLEVYFDIGVYLAGKSTTIILNSDYLKCITLLLNSKLMSFFYKRYYGSLSLQSGYLRIGPLQIKNLPIPKELGKIERWFRELTDYLLFLNTYGRIGTQQKEITQFIDSQIADSLVCELYLKEKFYEDGLYPESKEYLLRAVSKHLKPINYDRWAQLYWRKQLEGNLTKEEEEEFERLEEENLKTIGEVYIAIIKDRQIQKQIEKIKSHQWVKMVEGEEND